MDTVGTAGALGRPVRPEGRRVHYVHKVHLACGGPGPAPPLAPAARPGRITPMASALTPEDYELALRDLEGRLDAFLQSGEGSRKELRRQAEDVLSLAEQFPEVYARHPQVEGLVAELLARQQQEKYMAFNAPREAPGCMFGWLLGRRRK